MRLPPDAWKAVYEQTRAYLLAGQGTLDSELGDNSVKLSTRVRAHKLAEIVGNLQAVLAHLDIDPDAWYAAEESWHNVLHCDAQVRAKCDLLQETVDVREEAARILAGPGPTTSRVLAVSAAVALGPQGQPWILGYALREGRVVLRAVDPALGTVVWECLSDTLSWNTPARRGSFVVRGRRLFVIHESSITAVDVADGRHLWSAPLPAVDVYDSLGRARLFMPDGRTPIVLAQTSLSAHDEETGQELWRRHGSPHSIVVQPLDGVGVVVFGLNGAHATALVLETRTGAVLCSFGTLDGRERVRWVEPLGTPEAMALEIVREDGAAMMLIADPRTGRPLEITPRISQGDERGRLVLHGRPVWLHKVHRMDPSVSLVWTEPSPDPAFRQRGGRVERCMTTGVLDTGFERIDAVVAAGAIVMAAAGKLLALDARTLQVRFEQPLPGMVRIRSEGSAFIVKGPLVVFVGDNRDPWAPTPPLWQLSAVDARDGRLLWQVPAAQFKDVTSLGIWLVCERYDRGLSVLRLDSGAVAVTWPPAT